MKRQISIVVGALIIIAGYWASNHIAGRKKEKRPPAPKSITAVFTSKVANQHVDVVIKESGRLMAKNRANLYAEVQGVMKVTSKAFKEGVHFRKGESLAIINSDDAEVKLLAQKSVLQNLITTILPDLRLDYPEAYPKWNQYVSSFDVKKMLAPLPETGSDKEKYFITGKNIYSTFYNTKNLEIVQGKYNIRAPFSGVVTEALINPGTVIRPGQKLGELIDPSVYELELAINQSFLSSISVGKEVRVSDPNGKDQIWAGRVARINGKIEASTQTIKVFVELKGVDLKEGIFLEAEIGGEQILEAIEVDRKLLVEGNKLYAVVDGRLKLLSVTVVHKKEQTVIVKGLTDGTVIASKIVPGAFEGMEVKIFTDK